MNTVVAVNFNHQTQKEEFVEVELPESTVARIVKEFFDKMDYGTIRDYVAPYKQQSISDAEAIAKLTAIRGY